LLLLLLLLLGAVMGVGELLLVKVCLCSVGRIHPGISAHTSLDSRRSKHKGQG
jgi:hypothetical protein